MIFLIGDLGFSTGFLTGDLGLIIFLRGDITFFSGDGFTACLTGDVGFTTFLGWDSG